MIAWVALGAMLVLVCFAFVLVFGAPYLPTLKPQIEAAFALLNLKPGQTLLELGCGDGRILKVAGERGLKAVGYELNPLLLVVARLRTWHYRKNVKVYWANFWTSEWPRADGIFTFLLPKFMPKLNIKVIQYKSRPIKLVSFAFEIPGRKPTRTHKGLLLYQYK